MVAVIIEVVVLERSLIPDVSALASFSDIVPKPRLGPQEGGVASEIPIVLCASAPDAQRLDAGQNVVIARTLDVTPPKLQHVP